MSARGRVVVVVVVTALLTGSLIFFIASFLRNRPPTVRVTAEGGETSLVLQTVGALGYGSKPDWVSYLAQQPDVRGEQSTMFELPAFSTIHVNVYQYDSQTGLRNPFFAEAPGPRGWAMTVDGRSEMPVLDPAEAAHTFTIPDLGVAVPLKGIANNATNPCQVAPCTEDMAHVTIEFTFKTGAPGTYRWQCFVPCAAGFLNGNGGPMQTVGFMDGFVDVV